MLTDACDTRCSDYYSCVVKKSLTEIAASSDATITKAHVKLVTGVREAVQAGMTQTEIATQVGRS